MMTWTALTTLNNKAQAEALGEALETLTPEPTGVGVFEVEDGSGVWEVGWPAVFVRRGAGAEATRAAGAMREWAAERGGVPPGRRITPMDPVEKLVLGLY